MHFHYSPVVGVSCAKLKSLVASLSVRTVESISRCRIQEQYFVTLLRRLQGAGVERVGDQCSTAFQMCARHGSVLWKSASVLQAALGVHVLIIRSLVSMADN